jgi:5'-deoxynucleotidase YfbR-like HD superfamily hydrolase
MNFLTDIYRLSYIKRYSNIPKLHEESVAEHGFYVAAIVIKLREKYEFYLEDALVIAVSHDMTEMELNDCPHIIKQKYPSIAKAYQECEEEVADQLPEIIAWGSREFDKQDKTVEAKIVHLADCMQCLQFAGVELKLGNTGYMQTVYSNSEARIEILTQELQDYERNRTEC